jgi:predicted phosphoadenosine phosphosulfate sulfurtransferase
MVREKTMGAKLFLSESCLDAARSRIQTVFDQFENIIVSVSGGKDSTALFGLAHAEAQRQRRKISLFFLDQEAEYAGSIAQIEWMMEQDYICPLWYQVPLRLTNATSYAQEFLYAWEPGAEWMRSKWPRSIQHMEEDYPQRFYEFFAWMEKSQNDTAFLVGLRAEESLNRFRAVVKNPGFEDVLWSTKTKNLSSFRFYPLFDWGMGDVWKYIAESRLPYNAIYDKMLRAGQNYYHTMRVSNLCHEKSFTCLTRLQELEPETFDLLIARLKGVHVASLYAQEETMFSNRKLPVRFQSWREYRDYLLTTTPLTEQRRSRFENRFAGQKKDESVFRQQVRQLLTNDWENSLAADQNKAEKRKAVLEKWRAIL